MVTIILKNNPDVRDFFNIIIYEEIIVKDIKDIYKAFEHDLNNEFKTIMKWEI